MTSSEPLLPKHGGYRKLKSFQVARLIYDLTVRFCDRYIGKRSRTHDQMVQAARSGVQNIAEGSQASGTSKKIELKLTNVARGSLEELRLDYEDFLRPASLLDRQLAAQATAFETEGFTERLYRVRSEKRSSRPPSTITIGGDNAEEEDSPRFRGHDVFWAYPGEMARQ